MAHERRRRPEIEPDDVFPLCRALERELGKELGQLLICKDVSALEKRWDFEAWNSAQDVLLRRVSYVRAVSERLMKAGAEIGKELWGDLEHALATRGVRDQWVHFGVRQLPKSKTERRALTLQLAERIDAHLRVGVPITKNELEEVMQGRHPFADPITKAFHHVGVVPSPKPGAAKVITASGDGLASCEPPLHEDVLPAIFKKEGKHRELARDLTLVVQTFDRTWTEGEIDEVRSVLRSRPTAFRSIYLARRCLAGSFERARVS